MIAQVDVRCEQPSIARRVIEQLGSFSAPQAPTLQLHTRTEGLPDLLVRYPAASEADARGIEALIMENLLGLDGVSFGGLTWTGDGSLDNEGNLVRDGQITDWPGYVDGLHYTAWVDRVRDLRRAGDDAAAEFLLLRLVDATEAESAQQGLGVAPWYYEQLAIIYAKRKQADREIAILERFAAQSHAPGAKPPALMERLEKARRRSRERDSRD